MKPKITDHKSERLECAAHWYLETAATGYCYKYNHGNCTLLQLNARIMDDMRRNIHRDRMLGAPCIRRRVPMAGARRRK